MATNFEFYKDKILEIVNKDDDFGVVNGEVGGCRASKCDKCLFYICDGLCSSVSKIQWLYAEHIEAPKLTKRERAFCDAVQTGWMVRDGKYLYWHIVQPIKDGDAFVFPLSKDGVPMVIKTKGITFDVIKNKEMMAVEDLLKLEAEA